MDLHRHLGSQIFLFESAVNGNHRHFDDISSCSLNRSVHGVAFSKGTDGSILRMDIRQVAFAAEERLCVAFLARELFLGFNITDYPRESCEIIVNELFGFGTAAFQLLRQTKSRDTINDTKISGFGFSALVFGHLVNRQTVNPRRRSSVDILTRPERR